MRLKEEINAAFGSELDWYAKTADLWSSKTTIVILALTLHYLTEDFQMRSFVMEVKPFAKGRHTGEYFLLYLIL